MMDVFSAPYLLYILGMALLLAAMLGAWSLSLRRQLAVRTAELDTCRNPLSGMAANLPGAVFRKRYAPDGASIDFVSERCQDILGRSAAEIMTMPISEQLRHLWHRDDHAVLESMATETFSGRDQSSYEIRACRPNGSECWVSIRERVVERTENGIVTEGILLDVTAEVEARRALEQREAELREASLQMQLILESLPGAVYRKSYAAGQSQVDYVSPRYSELTGGRQPSPDNYANLGERLKIWHPDDQSVVLELNRRMATGTSSQEIRARILRADGSWVWVLARERVMYRQGDTITTGGLIIDINDEMTARQALERSEADLRQAHRTLGTIIANLPGKVFRIHYDSANNKRMLFIDGSIVRVGPAVAAEPLGPMMEAAKVRFHHPDDFHLLFEEVPRRLRETGYSEQTFRYRPTEDVPWTWIRAYERVTSRDGNEMISEGIMLDVTAELAAKKALEQEEDELARLREGMAEARRLAALGGLAGGIAHDFNNLLGAILGYAGFIVEDSAPNSGIRRHASRIVGAGRRGQDLVEQVMMLTGRRTIHRQSVELAELLLELVRRTRDALPVSTHIAFGELDTTVVVEADRHQLARAIDNLVANALEVLGRRGGMISVELRSFEAIDEVVRRLGRRTSAALAWVVETWEINGEHWAVTGRLCPLHEHISIVISDTGRGMEADVLSQAFLPFFTTWKRARNPGLGLSVAQGIVIAHDGAMIVRSCPGKGTSVEFVLPTPAGH